MRQRDAPEDAPVNNLMVRSQSASRFRALEFRFPLRADALAAFSWLFHDREGFYTL